MNRVGVILINLGTPDQCTVPAVYRYLTEFLNDPRVIDLPGLARWILANILIIPSRVAKSTAAYQKVWTPMGSPLRRHMQQLQVALAHDLGAAYQVVIGMRYGQPSIVSALAALKNCASLIIIPLFPQYASAASGSALASVLQHFAQQWVIPSLHIVRDFYDEPAFIQAYKTVIQDALRGQRVDKVIFSYHGLPERHIIKSHCKASCDRLTPCPVISVDNASCYRAQCYKTSELLASSLGFTPTDYHVAFQSRLGRTPWIKPYLDQLLPDLQKQGVRSIAMVCPSFVADCLETLEEINIRARAQWLALGGKNFIFVPCLNAHSAWVNALAMLVKRYQPPEGFGETDE